MDKSELLKKERILAYKIIAESFLINKGNEVTDKTFPKDVKKEDLTLVEGDILVLHHWLAEQYSRVGLDLNKLIEANGEQVVEGQLSQFEIKELAKKADELLLMMSVIKQYVDAKQNKQG